MKRFPTEKQMSGWIEPWRHSSQVTGYCHFPLAANAILGYQYCYLVNMYIIGKPFLNEHNTKVI